jgi:hypothetical protein
MAPSNAPNLTIRTFLQVLVRHVGIFFAVAKYFVLWLDGLSNSPCSVWTVLVLMIMGGCIRNFATGVDTNCLVFVSVKALDHVNMSWDRVGRAVRVGQVKGRVLPLGGRMIIDNLALLIG